MRNTTITLYAVFLTILWSLLPFVIITQMTNYYYWTFDRYNVYQAFEVEAAAVDSQFASVIEHTQPPFNSSMDPRFFSREDIAHMQDVRLLAGGAYLSVLISFAVIAFTHGLGLTLPAKAREKLTLGGLTLAIKIQKIVLLVLGLLAMIALVFWRELFILFHQILFPFNSYWLLDPNTSNLIKYFPQGIFQELSLLYILLLVVFSEILQWIAARSSRK